MARETALAVAPSSLDIGEFTEDDQARLLALLPMLPAEFSPLAAMIARSLDKSTPGSTTQNLPNCAPPDWAHNLRGRLASSSQFGSPALECEPRRAPMATGRRGPHMAIKKSIVSIRRRWPQIQLTSTGIRINRPCISVVAPAARVNLSSRAPNVPGGHEPQARTEQSGWRPNEQ